MQQTNNAPPTMQHGLVVSYFGKSVAVETKDGQIFPCQLHRNQSLPVVGDEVLWELQSKDSGVIHSILPRRSVVSRGDGHDKMKPIAANVDALIIVMAPPPIFSGYLVDRYVVAAELLTIPVAIVLNKIDLLTNALEEEKAYSALLPYRNIPYPVILSSIYLTDGLQTLAQFLAGKTSVLVGPSGVGKSSIIARLTAGDAVRVGEVTDKGIGKHTTTVTKLYHLPDGGQLIDSPGVREFSLWPITKSEILKGFKEFQAYANQCKFRDCCHLSEPSCGVQAAVESGKISVERLNSYKKLMQKAS